MIKWTNLKRPEWACSNVWIVDDRLSTWLCDTLFPINDQSSAFGVFLRRLLHSTELSDRFGIPTASIVNLNFAHSFRIGFRQNPLQNQWTQSDAISHTHTQSQTHTQSHTYLLKSHPDDMQIECNEAKTKLCFSQKYYFPPVFFSIFLPLSPVEELCKFNLAGFPLRHCSLNCRSRTMTTQRWIQQWIALVAHNPIKFK